MENLKTVTYEQFLTFNPCWQEGKAAELARIASARPEWTALDVLSVEGVEAEDKLWAVLREDFLPANLLHEFACRCAERAQEIAGGEPDPRSVAAIEAKRRWLKGEISGMELDAARAAARAAAWAAARDAARDAARAAAWAATRAAAQAAAWGAAWDAAWEYQITLLTGMIREWPDE